MKVVRFFYKDIGLGLLLFSAPFLLPRFAINSGLDGLVTPISTIFAIVAGFFIADAMSNYLRLQTLVAEENASLISLADDAEELDKKNSKNVYEAIDGYMVAQLNFNTLHHASRTEKETERIGAAIDTLHVEKYR